MDIYNLLFSQYSDDIIIPNNEHMTNTGYFTSRNQILHWVNDLLKTSLTKIEQLGSGTIYCHLLDAAYPQKIALNKVKWSAYLEVDFIHNFKILQAGFQRLGIPKRIDIQRLCKARYQDNLEFIQWMKWQLEHKIKENSYNALARRQHAQINLNFCQGKGFDLKQTLTKDVKQLKLTSVHSVPILQSPTYSKIHQMKEKQGYSALARKSLNKTLIQSKENIKTVSSSLIIKSQSKDKRTPQITIKTNKPMFNKTNLVYPQIKESDEQECF